MKTKHLKHDIRAQNLRAGIRESGQRIKNALVTGATRLGNARVREIVPAAAWGAMDLISGGRHTFYQNQKLSDKVDDALGRPMRPARKRRAGK